MMKTFFLFLFPGFLLSQALPIAIDSRFEDWQAATAEKTDPSGDATGLDLLKLQVANDENYLFLHLELAQEIRLTDDNDLVLYLDTDEDAQTGKNVNGIGAELELRFGDLEGKFYPGSQSLTINLNETGFRHQPTVSSEVIEMALARDAFPDGVHPLFTGSGLRISLQNGNNGDRLPDAGQTFSYLFETTPPLPYEPVALEKISPQHLRLLTWNTLFDGLDDLQRQPHFRRVLAALQPDVMTFNECWDMTAPAAATFLNVAVPLGGFQSWKAVKLDAGNITLSRFPILQSWEIFPGHRLTASLIDLPDDVYSLDLLVINAHLKCCGDGDAARQQEADAVVKFLLDARSPGGLITLPEGTPFYIGGDLNLVGWRQQLTTLLDGDVVNQGQFGPGGLPDWDDSPLLDVIALQADERMAYTWQNEFSDFTPSRLDFHLVSNSVLNVEKAFTLQTETMSADRLNQYDLQQNDTHSASDHYPKVTDIFIVPLMAAPQVVLEKEGLHLSPNPAKGRFFVDFFSKKTEAAQCVVFDFSGKKRWQGEWAGIDALEVPAVDWPAGVYVVEVRSGERVWRGRVVKV